RVEDGRPSLTPFRSTEKARKLRVATAETKMTIAMNRPPAAFALTHNGHLLNASPPIATAHQNGPNQRKPRGKITDGPATGADIPSMACSSLGSLSGPSARGRDRPLK